METARALLAAGMEVTPNVRLVSPLGAGGMGAVWLADHTALSTRVVVKFMLGGLDTSASARARFKREAEAASQVKSPHVVQTFDYGLTGDDVPFIVMEHLEGRDLGREIAEVGPLDPRRVVMIVQQVARALTKAHAAGLLHRDIKPDNIFLCAADSDDELFVKILDFGIAKTATPEGEDITLDGQTKTGQVVGTPFYMSPEQVTAQKVIDHRCDLWALGVVAYEALTGKRPFDGPSFGALAVKIATGELPKPSRANPSLPATIDAWFGKACARDPLHRFATAREMSDAFRNAFEGVVSLPPAISGMSDSGPREGADAASGTQKKARPSTPQASRLTPQPGVAAGPISVGDGDHDRPSFVLASTAASGGAHGGDRRDPHSGDLRDAPADSGSLARSEPGTRAGAGPTRRSGGPIVGVVIGVVIIATAVGVGIGKRDGEPVAGSASAPPTPAPSLAASIPTVPVLAASASASAPASASPSAPASVSATASASASPPASGLANSPPARPSVAPPVVVTPLPPALRPTAAPASAPPPAATPVARPDAGRHGDILY